MNQIHWLTCDDVALHYATVVYTNLHQQQSVLVQLQKIDIGN
jgi:hypothetical protein